MKNVFNSIRKKVNGKWPYIVSIDGSTNYLFEVRRYTSLRNLRDIQIAFEGENLIFATIDPEFTHHMSMKDAAQTYISGRKYPIYFYNGSVFFDIEEVKRKGSWGAIDLVLTDRVAPIQTIQLLG